MPKLIDADKLLEWLHKELENTCDPHAAEVLDFAIGEIEDGTFDPTPVQPDTPKLGDKVKHKKNPDWGSGKVMAVEKTGKKNALVYFESREYKKQLTECEFIDLEGIKDE